MQLEGAVVADAELCCEGARAVKAAVRVARDGAAPEVGAYEFSGEGNPGWLIQEGFKEFAVIEEEVGGTELVELLEGTAGLVQQLVLRALRGQTLEFVLDDTKVGAQTLQPFASTLGPGAYFLFFGRDHSLHLAS